MQVRGSAHTHTQEMHSDLHKELRWQLEDPVFLHIVDQLKSSGVH